jgi:CRP-like cAMP-binding protein
MLTYLDADDQAALLARATHLVYSPGDTIVREGSLISAVFVIRQGRVNMERHDGRTVVFARLDDGDVFGEAALLGRRRASVSYVAVDEVGMDVINAEAIEELIAARPEFGVRLFRSLGQGLADHCQQLAETISASG